MAEASEWCRKPSLPVHRAAITPHTHTHAFSMHANSFSFPSLGLSLRVEVIFLHLSEPRLCPVSLYNTNNPPARAAGVLIPPPARELAPGLYEQSSLSIHLSLTRARFVCG